MSFLKSSTPPLYLLTFIFLLPTISGLETYVYHSCSRPANFTANDIYETNLQNLTTYLSSVTPPTGFNFTSVGQGQDQVYGLAQCRGDVPLADCTACLTRASIEIHTHCPFKKRAIIWYETCLLRYSSKECFRQIDYENRFFFAMDQNVSHPMAFRQKTVGLLSQLASEALLNQKQYVAGKIDLGNSKQLYGFAQCSRDLWNIDCHKCLSDSIALLSGFAEGKVGAQVVGGSCSVRYETNPFVAV